MSLELHPAHDEIDGSIIFTLAPQNEVKEGAFPTFDHNAAISVKFSISELAKMIEVLRGYTEKINDGAGLCHRTATANTRITFEHSLEPVPCYSLNVTRKSTRKSIDREARTICVNLSLSEALVLNEVISQSLVYVAFGVPADDLNGK